MAAPHDGLPLRFSNLSIPGRLGENEDLVADVASSLYDVVTAGPFRRLLGVKKSQGEARAVIEGVDGLVHQGELLLIIGPPSAPSTTLLRALSSPADLPLSDTSALDYGLLPPSSVSRKPALFSRNPNDGVLRSEVVYMSEHDVHFATLSLEASMMPASLAKTPRVRERGQGRREWATERLRSYVDALGLGHAMGTAVGNSFVRGLSGGERKRASIIEALITRASVLLLDKPTSGLDSSTALELITYLRSWAKEGKKSLVATAPHIADPLYLQFDKVLVLSSKGRQVYFGKTTDAQSYFEGLGLRFRRRTAAGEGCAEFIVGCIEGRGLDHELERSWRSSGERKALMEEMKEYEARYPFDTCAGPLFAAVQDEKSRWTPNSSHYTVSFVSQIVILTRRQYALVASELPTYVTKTIVNLLISVLVGTLFFNLPETTSAAFTRGSLLLLSVVFNAYLSLAGLGKTLEGRDIVKRQGDWGFFGASALALARLAGDVPLIGAQVLLFGTITYTLAGLQRTMEQFAIYLLFVFATALNLSAMFRMSAALSPSFDVAIRYCGLSLNLLVVYAGYFIPTPSMRPSLRWIHYVLDPISYAYESVLTNEFRTLNLACSTTDIVPSGPTYLNPTFQTCLLPGSTPNSLFVTGDSYLLTAYNFSHDHLWSNLSIMLLQTVVFLVIGVIATDYLHFAPEGTKRIWARTKSVKSRMDRMWYKSLEGGEQGLVVDDMVESMDDSTVFGEEDASPCLDTEGSVLVWRDVSLWVDTPLETRRLLDRVSGYIQPGALTALMGASGAGKSTLLSVLAGRSDGVMKGTVLVDGRAPSEEFYRTTGLVDQFDLHDDRATVREALEFSALLRQNSSIPLAEKLAYVDVVLNLLDLAHLEDAIVGSPSAGLNPEQRKRLSIAVEVVSRPAILFCDEPTTGLDSKSALRVVKLLRRLARSGLAVVATIHQPSAEAFEMFDSLLLLQRGGKQVYFGPRALAVDFFSSYGVLPKNANPADFLLEAAGAGVGVPDERLETLDDLDILPQQWTSSPEFIFLHTTIGSLSDPSHFKTRHATSSATTYQQCYELTKRVSRNFYRDRHSYTKLFTATLVSLLIGLSFFQLGHTVVSLQNRLFSVFLILFVPPVFMNLAIFKMISLRALWEARERPGKIYGRTAFVTSLVLSELPYSIVCAAVYFTIWYTLVGFPFVASTIFYTFTMVQLFFFFMSTWAMWITALAPSLGVIANLLPFFLASMEAFNGALMPYAQMPSYWRWLYWISPFQWYVRGILGVLLHDLPIQCSADELVTFAAPSGQTCVKYASEYLSTAAGYLVNPNARGLCDFCKISTGDDYLSLLNISHSDRWISLSLFASFTISNVALIYLFTFFPPRIPNFKRLMGGGRKRALEIAEEELRREESQAEGTRESVVQPVGAVL